MTLEEDFAELLDATLEEDFALLLDFTLLLDFALLLDPIPPSGVLDDDEGVTLEEDLSLTLEEDLSLTLEEDSSSMLEEDSSSMLLDDSSSRGAKLLSSSQAAKRKILAIKNTIPMCPTHFNDDKSPNFFICPPSKSYTTNITKTPHHIVKNACKQTFSAHFGGLIRFKDRSVPIPGRLNPNGEHMTRSEFIAFVKDVAEHPEHLADYRKIYKNVYPFSDGIFKMLMANEAKPERTVKFLNAMLGLVGDKAIKTYTLGVPENPGVLNDKTAIFDIYGTTQAGEPVLIEVQQNFNTLFVDRLIYYTSRVVSRTVKKSQDYNLPHIYVLSLLTENQFPTEIDTYLHHAQLVRNRHLFYEKLDIYLVEIEKFFAIEDRTPPERREQSDRAEMLRIFRDVLEEKEIPEEKLKKLLDKDFAKDVSLEGYTDETLLNEVDGMTDMLYEKQGSYIQGGEDKAIEIALAMLADNEPIDKVVKYSKLPKEKILKLKTRATKGPVSA